jgi:hypothetical protein
MPHPTLPIAREPVLISYREHPEAGILEHGFPKPEKLRGCADGDDKLVHALLLDVYPARFMF